MKVTNTPGDAIYFHYGRINRNRFISGEIDSKKYNINNALLYYLPNSLWWCLVGLIVYNLPTTTHNKVKWGLGLIGGGIAVSVILKNIQKDKAVSETLKRYNIKLEEDGKRL
jgi:hypothetical protein